MAKYSKIRLLPVQNDFQRRFEAFNTCVGFSGDVEGFSIFVKSYTNCHRAATTAAAIQTLMSMHNLSNYLIYFSKQCVFL